MKVVLVNSPLFRTRNLLYDEDSLPPIGLGYIGTHLRRNGIDVSLIDAVHQRIPLVDLIDQLHEQKPDFVGVNIFTTNYELVKELVEGLHFSTHIVVGGLSTKQLYEAILSWRTANPIDVVTGDGELIMLDIVSDSVKDPPFKIEGNRRVFRIDQSSRYLVHDISSVTLDRSFFLNEPVRHPLGFIEGNIVASRGCVYNCTFCAAARSLNKDYPVRERTKESIMTELQNIATNYTEVSSIRILDDLFLKSKESIDKAVNVFSPFRFQWRSMAHVQTFRDVDEVLMLRLKQSGCQELFIGVESGSPKILADINKTKDLVTIIANLTKVFRAGINMKGYFIYGFPGETEEDMEKTYQLALQLKELAQEFKVNFRTSVFQYRPYHSTQIYHELEALGKKMCVTQVAPNEALSRLVGRQQFNFHSGNYSAVDYQIVQRYIYATTNLNGDNLFAEFTTSNQVLQKNL
ncbi:B12-binding domain-containing radical SAM protein [Segetibacter sp. 3557_3]|uniref:B12-binding domain-containing radical SAM protein n=1 Tax=Segetibacter sp. 3557_3 TaxID=2547429 RepID=UPI0010588DC8|nr:radical SAM protein [Segetibacter sp. 3557_3]TDH18250.1 B12-binding domain-containing radical SAM protein [Segetibacter sp. 3557_3]